MKAIVANVLFGSILGCLSWANSACANSSNAPLPYQEAPISPVLSAKLLSSDKLLILPQIINLVDRIFTVNNPDTYNYSLNSEAQIIFGNRFSSNLKSDRDLNLNKLPYTHKERQANLVLGFQKTFWPSDNKQKYWGITTVEHWGDVKKPFPKLNLAKLNYTNLAPTLKTGSSIMTISGGGNSNLVTKARTSSEFDRFRGGVTYHRGVVDDVTMGVGFVYEDFLIGFTQLTYDSDFVPLKTTISLLAKESGLDFRSHVRFQPADNLTLNYYHERDRDKFDANLKLIPGLILTAKSDSKNDSFTTGVNLAIQNQYMSISAKAAMDGDRNLQWKLNSQIGNLKFAHSSNLKKSKSEVNLDLLDEDTVGFQCSAFVKYQTREVKQNQEDFTVWGSKLQSAKKITPNQHLWTVNLGYGSGNHGSGLVASGSVALNRNLLFELSYQEVSAASDDTKVKLQLSSK